MSRFLRGLRLFLMLAVSLLLWLLLPWYGVLAAVAALVLWLVLARRGRQALLVTRMGFATLSSRRGSSSVVVAGIAGVVAVLVSLFAMAQGLEATLARCGNETTAMVLHQGAISESTSLLDRNSALLTEHKPGVAHDADDQPIASPELVAMASLQGKNSDREATVAIRGVGSEAWAIRPNVKIIAGRKFTPGLRELDVGKDSLKRFAGLGVGSTVNLNDQVWKVVGEFDSGDAFNSELWGDLDTVATTYRKGSSVSSVTVKLTGPEALGQYKAALKNDPSLKVTAQTTEDYYADQAADQKTGIFILGTTAAIIMGLGAFLGALSSMYTAVSTRLREIATLRALGFGGIPVVISVMFEAMLLALGGGILGALVAYAIFGHFTASAMGGGFTQVVFEFRITPELLWTGIKWALAIGFLGGVLPAIRAATIPVAAAFREL